MCYTSFMKSRTTTQSVFANSKYFGKHVLIAKDHILAVKSAKKASELFDELVKKGTIPTVTFVPKSQSLILVWR